MLSWSAIVNLMYQLDWAMECPCIWSKIILGVSVRVFSDEINVWISWLRKADWPPYCEWASSKHLKTWIEKADPPTSKKELHLSDCLILGQRSFSVIGLELKHRLFLSVSAFRLELTYYWQSLFSGLQTYTDTTLLALLGFQLAWLYRSWTSETP